MGHCSKIGKVGCSVIKKGGHGSQNKIKWAARVYRQIRARREKVARDKDRTLLEDMEGWLRGETDIGLFGTRKLASWRDRRNSAQGQRRLVA